MRLTQRLSPRRPDVKNADGRDRLSPVGNRIKANPNRSGASEVSPERFGLHPTPGAMPIERLATIPLSQVICEQSRLADAVCKLATLDRPSAEH